MYLKDSDLCPLVPGWFYTGNAGTRRSQPESGIDAKAESALRGTETYGRFGQDHSKALWGFGPWQAERASFLKSFGTIWIRTGGNPAACCFAGTRDWERGRTDCRCGAFPQVSGQVFRFTGTGRFHGEWADSQDCDLQPGENRRTETCHDWNLFYLCWKNPHPTSQTGTSQRHRETGMT